MKECVIKYNNVTLSCVNKEIMTMELYDIEAKAAQTILVSRIMGKKISVFSKHTHTGS